jgi:hypothetical protein
VRADEPARRSAESLLEQVRPVHRVVLSCDVRGNTAEVESARASLACFDDAPPEERVCGVGGAANVVRRRALIDIALTAPPGQGAGDRLAVLLRETDLRVPGGDECPPHPPVVLPATRDESGALPGLGVEVIERAEVVIAARVSDTHTPFLRLADAPARVLL